VRIEASVPVESEPKAESDPAPASRLRRLDATRIMASAEALDATTWPDQASVLRIAPDECLVLARSGESIEPATVADVHAIIEPETGFSGAWLPAEEAAEALARTCAWQLPSGRPAFAQGAVAEVPVKLLLEADRVLFVVQTPLAHELEDRLW